MYRDIFDGLRGYYARYPSRRATAGFHAAMTMSLLACITLVASMTVIDYVIRGNLDWALTIFHYKFLLLAIGIIVAFFHVQFGKRTGRYKSTELHAPPHWKRYVTIYAGLASVMLLSAVIVAVIG